MYVIIKQ